MFQNLIITPDNNHTYPGGVV